MAFNPVGVGHAVDILFGTVLDRFMPAAHSPIPGVFIGVNHSLNVSLVNHKPLKRRRIG